MRSALRLGSASVKRLMGLHRGQHGRRAASIRQGRVRRLLECGMLAHGFLRLRCGECGHDKLLAFSRKRRGFCLSCGARRMSQTAAHLVAHVIPHVPVRQWVLSLPIPQRVLLAAPPELVTPVLQVVPGPRRGVPVQRRWRACLRRGGCAHRRRPAWAAAVRDRLSDEDAYAPWRAGRGHGPDLPGRGGCRRRGGAHAAAAAGCGPMRSAAMPLACR